MQFSVPRSTPAAAFLRRWQLPLLAAITLLAAFLRFYNLPNMPPGLFSDEGWSGVMARQVLQTGQIQVFFPTNQGVEPFVVYLAVPIVAIFGNPVWQLRIPEALIGTLTVPAVWWLCREMFGRRSAPDSSEDEYVTSSLLGLGSALLLALLYWHIDMSRIGMEPILVPFFMCLAFAALARALDTRRGRDYALAGLALACNLYTYKAGYAVPILAGLFVAYTALAERGFLKREWRHLAIWVGAALLAYLPMIGFIVTHPDAFFTRFGSVTVESRFAPQLDIAGNALKTLGMYFITGDESQRYNIPYRPALDPLLAILFLGGLGISLWGWRKARQGLPAMWLVVMSLPTTFSEFAPHWGRAVGITPILAVLCALGALGIWRLGACSDRRWAAPAAVAALSLAVIASGAIAIRDYFVTYSRQKFLFYSFDEGPLKLGQYANTIPADQRVYVVTDLPDSYTLQYVIERPYVTYDGRNGTVYPAPGQAATAIVIQQRAKSMFRAMQAARPDAKVVWQLRDNDRIFFARALGLPASGHPAVQPSQRVTATLGDSIRLLGYDLVSGTVRPGDKVDVMLYWESLKPVGEDYTVFAHLVAPQPQDGGDPLLAGADRQPVNASYQTSQWQPGETILDRHVITVPPDAPAGVYQLRVGMYLLATLERLPALDDKGVPVPGSTIELGTVQVTAK